MKIPIFFDEAADEVGLSEEELVTYSILVNLFLWTVKTNHELNQIPVDEFEQRDEKRLALEKFETQQQELMAIASERELEAFKIFVGKCTRQASLSQTP